jgi:hypothetical protein
MAMRAALLVLALFWLTPLVFFGWRLWATWPSKRQRKLQGEISRLYDHHFDQRRRRLACEGVRPALRHSQQLAFTIAVDRS